jgi:uncharacterized membrane protein YsdA (DUF1294 family)
MFAAVFCLFLGDRYAPGSNAAEGCAYHAESVNGVLLVYGLMSAVAFAMYWSDKRRAHRGDWRIPEATLHTIELFGGWPGAWIAQRALRHKSSKRSYRMVFWVIVMGHAAGWLWWSAQR